ncbi:phosphatidylserine synthase [Aggregatimonas sangjinii]|uniref:Phosphatidylserine synthase n=1 Tax=Aggregatimonas sangjinii TaxID=2583587 RepID=A0A5B7STQ2_9FLAO|nr:CDP-alcohol phosphatidyltransferase family protein [Aggregatimonas sangjinii]QCX00719.1 phosphatidylserine synthase [Aggregatimonas sangjinii]
MKKHIPNGITLLNVFSGCVAAVFAVLNQMELAALFVFLGIVFDFFDGMAARLLDVKSELGLQLDSLADMITSGLVPGIVMFQLLGMSMSGGWNLDFQNEMTDAIMWTGMKLAPLPFVGFLITMASAYRLAKFNIDENQTTSFIGLPTPANALLILSLPLILQYQHSELLNEIILNQWFLIGLTLLSAFLLNAKIALFALKFKNWSMQDNALRYGFIVLSIIFLVTLKFLAVPLIILCYILSSVIANAFSK